jgi:hypothetical protein
LSQDIASKCPGYQAATFRRCQRLCRPPCWRCFRRPDVAATAPSKSYVTVTWTPAPGGMPLASYTVFRGTTASSLISLKTAPPASCTLMTLPYWWAIHTIRQCRPKTRMQLSPLSAIVTVTTPQPSPDKHSFRLSTLTTNNGNVDHAECLAVSKPMLPAIVNLVIFLFRYAGCRLPPRNRVLMQGPAADR